MPAFDEGGSIRSAQCLISINSGLRRLAQRLPLYLRTRTLIRSRVSQGTADQYAFRATETDGCRIKFAGLMVINSKADDVPRWWQRATVASNLFLVSAACQVADTYSSPAELNHDF